MIVMAVRDVVLPNHNLNLNNDDRVDCILALVCTSSTIDYLIRLLRIYCIQKI